MKRILIITPPCHFKNVGAAQRDIYSAISFFQNMGHEVVLYSIGSPSQDPAVLAQVGNTYHIAVRIFNPAPSLLDRMRRIVRHPALFDGAAYVFDQMVRSVEFSSFIGTYRPDVIFSFCSYSWPVLMFGKQKGIRTVFRSHNFESNFFLEALDGLRVYHPFERLRAVAKYFGEKKAIRYADAVGTLPFEQVQIYRRWKKEGVHILTLFFLPESLRPPHIRETDTIECFYLGASYNVEFHLRGAELLIEQIAPAVVAQSKGAVRFHICGGKLPERLVKQCGNGITYEGYVEDLEEFLSRMDVGVFPVMTGKTMKGKVFESVARAFPIVMSKNCLGGYAMIDGKQVLLADTVDTFVSQILSLEDKHLRERLANGAADFAKKEFGKERILSVLKTML